MRIDDETLFYEYEQILIGNKPSFSPYFFKYGENTSQHYALLIIKFAVEKYLGWDAKDMLNHFTKDIAIQMKLEPLMKYIDFPVEVNRDTDYYVLASMIYPYTIKIDTKELVLRTYKDVLKEKICKFPKEYLSGADGMIRAGICLQYMLNQYFSFNSTKELYQFFTESAGIKALKDYRLNNISSEIFEIPIDYLHESLPDVQKDEFWYHYFRFQAMVKLYEKQERKKEKALKKLQEKEDLSKDE